MPPFRADAEGRHREGIPAFLRHASLANLLSTPIVYSLCVPLLLLDLWTTVYQWVCFPMYGIARVRRRSHFTIDRHRLPYLNPIEKLHCLYCSYATGLLSYVMEVTARTEQYWCPIRHAGVTAFPHERHQVFADYGDGAAYRRGFPALRQQLAPPTTGARPCPGTSPASSSRRTSVRTLNAPSLPAREQRRPRTISRSGRRFLAATAAPLLSWAPGMSRSSCVNRAPPAWPASLRRRADSTGRISVWRKRCIGEPAYGTLRVAALAALADM